MAGQSLATRLKASPALLHKYQADPGLRSKLPDSYLTPAQRQVRQRNATNAAIGDPLAPLSGGTLQRMARSITDASYAPSYQDLDQQRAQTTANTTALAKLAGDYYKQLNDQNTAAQTAQGDRSTQLDARLAQIGTDATTGIQKAGQQGQDFLNKDAAVRGAGLQADSAAQLAQRIAGAQSQSSENNRISRVDATNQTANAGTLLAGLAGAGRLAGGEAVTNISTRGQGQLQDILNSRSKLDTQSAGDFAKNLMSLRDSQGQTQLAKATLLGNQASDASKAAADRAAFAEKVRHDKAQESNTANDPSKQKTAADLAFFKKHGYYPPTGPPKTGGKGKTKWATGAQQGDASSQIADALSWAKRFKDANQPRSASALVLTSGQKQQTLYNADGTPKLVTDPKTGETTKATTGNNVPKYKQLFASVALDIAYDGHISRANIRKLHAAGIKVGPLGYPTTAPPAGQQVNVSAPGLGGKLYGAG